MEITLRSAEEIQEAHDKISGVLLGEAPRLYISDAYRIRMTVACDVLCWVLQHDDNSSFEENIAKLDMALRDTGYRFEKLGNQFENLES